jgi:hypothetical protein
MALQRSGDDPATSRRIFPPRCACAMASLMEERPRMTFLMTCSCSLFHRISAQNYGADVTFIKIRIKPNAIGAAHNEAIGRRMTHSQGSNDSGLIVSLGFDPLLSRFEPHLFVFSKPAAAPRSTMPSSCSMPPQPDQLRRRHDRQHNGEGQARHRWSRAEILQ